MGLLEPAWYCIRSHPKHEHIAAANLRKLPGVETFFPQLRFIRATRRGWMRTTEPLFPTYLFARFVPALTLDKVRYTHSVNEVVHFGDELPTISDAVIEELRRNLQENQSQVFSDAPLQGQEVEISDGPLRGVQALVMRVLPAKERVLVLLNIMSRSIVAELSMKSLLCEKQRPPEFLLAFGNPTPRAQLALV